MNILIMGLYHECLYALMFVHGINIKCHGFVLKWVDVDSLVGFTRIAANFKFHSWFASFKLT